MNNIELSEQFGYRRTRRGIEQAVRGEIEFIIKDVNGNVVDRIVSPNIIKIYTKEVLSHRLPYEKVWDPTGGAGTGAWVSSGIDVNDELSAKYIVFGASFDVNGNPLDTADTRFYNLDSASGQYVPITLGPGADYNGGLINPIPISEPLRPLKRIERIYFEPSYQPAGTPLLQADVRALNNVIVLESTLQTSELNGFGVTNSDYFTITEVALVAGPALGVVPNVNDPHDLFLQGGSNGEALAATATGTATVSLQPGQPSIIGEGDQIKLVQFGATDNAPDTVNQITPYYLVVSQSIGGNDLTLDRTPTDINGNIITGPVGVWRDSWRIIAHRVLSSPLKKSAQFQIVARWRIAMA